MNVERNTLVISNSDSADSSSRHHWKQVSCYHCDYSKSHRVDDERWNTSYEDLRARI
jgi:hypothetical protein